MSRPGALPLRWRVGEEDQKHVDQQLHLDQFERSHIVEQGGAEKLALLEQWCVAFISNLIQSNPIYNGGAEKLALLEQWCGVER